MEISSLNEERAGLGSALNGGCDRWVPFTGLDDLSPFLGEIENAVWHEKEVSFATGSIDWADLQPIANTEAHRRPSAMIHAGVHHPGDGFARFFSGGLKGRKMRERLPC